MNPRRLLPLALVLAVGLPGTVAALVLLWTGPYALGCAVAVERCTLILAWFAAAISLRMQIHRPLRTVSSMLAALRAGDYSIRARHAGTNDPLALVFMEINALEQQFREQRLGALEATNVLHRVLAEIDVAVMAFDQRASPACGQSGGGATAQRHRGAPSRQVSDQDAGLGRCVGGRCAATP